jgi:short-subunit dehydrogenase
MRLDGRSILLTGATGGIGAEAARALVAAGARVLLVARDPARLEALARSIPAQPGHVAALAVDVTDANDRAALRDVAVARRVDTLVNNAGLPCFGALEEVDEARVAEVIGTNLVAPILLARLLLPWLRTLPRSAILNVGSTFGRLGVPGFSIYAASKFGLRGFTESLRRELAGSRVAVQYFAPRTTRTAFNSARVDAFNSATGANADDPADVARQLVRMLARGGAERHLGFTESLAARLNGFAPRLLDPAFRRHRDVLDDGPATDKPPTTLRTRSAR